MSQQSNEQLEPDVLASSEAGVDANWSSEDLRWVHLSMDLVCSILAALLALLLWNVEAPEPFTFSWTLEKWEWMVVLPAGTVSIFAMTGLYMLVGPDDFRASSICIFRSLVVFLFLYYTVYFFFSELVSLPRLVVLFYVLISAPLYLIWRRGLLWMANRQVFQQNLIFLGRPDPDSGVLQLFEKDLLSGLRPVGVYPFSDQHTTDAEPDEEPEDDGLRRLNPEHRLSRYAERLNASRIVVVPNRDELSDKRLDDLIDCHRMGADVSSMLQFIEDHLGRYPLEYARSHWERFFPSREDKHLVFRGLKRMMDITGALVGLLLFLPLFPFLAAGIKLTSSGPVLFHQERIGQGGNTFELIKLRTMVENAEEQSGPQWAEQNDTRITSFGAVLRALHLDEFPQFWHVLTGDMSLVGPRPERPEIEQELAAPNPLFKLRHSVKPGVTGWATIKLKYVDTIEKAEQRLEYDLFYMENQSIWLDLHIILMTCWNMVSFGGR